MFNKIFVILFSLLLFGCGEKLPDKSKRYSIFLYGDLITTSPGLANVENIRSDIKDIYFKSSRYDSNNINYNFGGEYTVRDSINLGYSKFSYFIVDKSSIYYKKINSLFILGNNGDLKLYDIESDKITTCFENKARKNFFFANIDLFEDKILHTSNDGYLSLINATNCELIWQVRNPKYSFYSGGVIDSGIFYGTSSNGNLYTINLNNGSENWYYEPSKNKIDFAGNIGSEKMIDSTKPLLFGEMLIFATKNNTLDFINKSSGAMVFSAKLDNTAKSNKSINQTIFSIDHPIFSPLLTNNLIFASSLYSGLHIINAQYGAILDVKGFGLNSPLVASQNFVYLVTNDGDLVALSIHTGEVKWTYKLENFYEYKVPKYMNNGNGSKKMKLNWRGPVSINDDLLLISPFGKMVLINANSGKLIREIKIPECVFEVPTIANNRIYMKDSCWNKLYIMY